MYFPTITSPQSRFVASFLAILTLLLFYLAFSNTHLAYASEAESIIPSDHNHPLVQDLHHEDQIRTQLESSAGDEQSEYRPDFPGLGGRIIGRQDNSALANNEPGKSKIAFGDTQYWVFPEKELGGQGITPVQRLPPSHDKSNVEIDLGNQAQGAELKKRQAGDRMLHITLSICSQPAAIDSSHSDPAPPLELYISYGPDNKFPGPNSRVSEGQVPTKKGLATYANNVSGDSFFGVHAPSAPGFNGDYSYEITASIDALYTGYENSPGLFYLDSDTRAGFFVTNNLTASNTSDSDKTAWLSSGSPFSIFVYDQNDPKIAGLENSYCCMKSQAPIKGNVKGIESSNVEVGMTSTGDGGLPKQQFYVKDLKGNSAYSAVMAWDTNYTQTGSSKVGAGGVVWPAIDFTTKSGWSMNTRISQSLMLTAITDETCQLIYNLSFCDTVNYAVPSNKTSFPDITSLANAYDQNALAYFQNFSNSLDQVPCDTISSAQYSLAANCNNCTAAYKRWLCAVTIPRCVDFSSTQGYLQGRRLNATFANGTSVLSGSSDIGFGAPINYSIAMNTSRNPFIDAVVQPGPYKELLPCKDLCYGLVQMCPASLQFACPLEGKAMNRSYGSGKNADGIMMCNKPGAIWGTSGTYLLSPSVLLGLMALSLYSVLGIVEIL